MRRGAPALRMVSAKFGEVPGLSVLHRGPVVAGECGDKRQIVYRGETLNTLARLEALAKGLGKDVVASEPGSGSLCHLAFNPRS